MLRKTLITLALFTAFAGTAAWAQDYTGDTDSSGRTVRRAEDVEGKYMKDEIVGIKPQTGVMAFNGDTLGDSDSRIIYGLTADWNLVSTIFPEDESMKSWFVGPSTGVLYSNLGGPGSDFFASTDNPGDGASVLVIPANLKVGYNVGRDVRLSAHGGANFVYRDKVGTAGTTPEGGAALRLGATDSAPGESDTTIFPNVGADFEFSLGSGIGLLLRPDATLVKDDTDLYTGTIGLNILLG